MVSEGFQSGLKPCGFRGVSLNAYFAGMRLLRLAHSILDHSVLVLWLSCPCLRASGRGGAWVPWRALPWSCCVFVASGNPGP